jgi:hypothetical protein
VGALLAGSSPAESGVMYTGACFIAAGNGGQGGQETERRLSGMWVVPTLTSSVTFRLMRSKNSKAMSVTGRGGP